MLVADELCRLEAGFEMVEWAGRRRSRDRAWRDCPRGDWLIEWAALAGADPRDVVRAAAACARLALIHVPSAEARPRLALDAAEAWADEPSAARAEAARAATTAATVAAAAAAWADEPSAGVAGAAEAAWAAAMASMAAGTTRAERDRERSAVWAEREAVESAGAQGTTAAGKAAARVAMHRRCADAVRRILPALPSLPDEMRRGTRPAVREWPR